MKKLLVSFDREFKEVLETINVKSMLNIVPLDKSLTKEKKFKGITNSSLRMRRNAGGGDRTLAATTVAIIWKQWIIRVVNSARVLCDPSCM